MVTGKFDRDLPEVSLAVYLDRFDHCAGHVPSNAPVSDTTEIFACLERMGLIAAGERPRIVPLSGGISSHIVRVDTARGPVCVKRALPQLKVSGEWRAPIERNSAELEWLRHAAGIVPGFVPQVIAQDRIAQAFAMQYLDADKYAVWKEQLRDGIVEPKTAESVAFGLGRIHAQTARSAVLAKDFGNDATFHAIRLEPYFAASAKVHADCAHALQRLIETTARTKLALVHGDVSPKNILVGKEGPVLLDAECAWYGDPAFDVAFCLNHLLLKCLWRPMHKAGYFTCFDQFASTYLGTVSWEPRAELEQRACALLAGMMLARVDGKSPVEYLTAESERDAVRRFARRFLLAPVERLADLRNAWGAELPS